MERLPIKEGIWLELMCAALSGILAAETNDHGYANPTQIAAVKADRALEEFQNRFGKLL